MELVEEPLDVSCERRWSRGGGAFEWGGGAEAWPRRSDHAEPPALQLPLKARGRAQPVEHAVKKEHRSPLGRPIKLHRDLPPRRRSKGRAAMPRLFGIARLD